jgi:uncharacterized protein YfaP (DUF2135 family)
MKRLYLKLLILSVLMVFAMGQLGGCLSCITETGSISGDVVSATTGEPISGATVRTGSISTTTGSDGKFKLENVPAGVQNVTAEKSGYISDSQSVLVVGGQETTNVHFALSPIMPTGQWRIVLTWGENPSDLDSHLLVPKSDTDGSLGYHIYYGNKGSNSPDTYPYAYLDVDDTSGYGPETITIFRRLNQRYKYYVHHYTGYGELANSGAVVKVYIGNQLMKTYNVPTQQVSGYLDWYVFDINADGTITDINVIQSSAPTLP